MEVETESLRFSPQPKQREFLGTSADIAVYGGAAGGGKSWALVYDPIRHIKVPGFTGIIFRRTSPEITNAGGLWDEAGELYPAAGGKAVQDRLEYRFKPKARISFRHLEHEQDKLGYQGSQICYLAFDELTHFSESQFWYMLSRNCSTCGVRPYVRATCNPQPGWVKSKLLAPWVDEDFKGERAKSGEIRWFRRIGGEITWVPEGTPKAKSVTFTPARVTDNPALLDVDPDYVNNLEALPDVERERLLHGNWAVRHEGIVYPEFEQCISNNAERLRVPPTHGGIDYGWRNPFCAVWGHVDHDDVFWITGCRYRSGVSIAIHSEALPKDVQWQADPAEPGLTRELCSAGHGVRSCVHIPVRMANGEKKNPKMAGIEAVSTRMRTGRPRSCDAQRRCRSSGSWGFIATTQPSLAKNRSTLITTPAMRCVMPSWVTIEDVGFPVSTRWKRKRKSKPDTTPLQTHGTEQAGPRLSGQTTNAGATQWTRLGGENHDNTLSQMPRHAQSLDDSDQGSYRPSLCAVQHAQR